MLELLSDRQHNPSKHDVSAFAAQSLHQFGDEPPPEKNNVMARTSGLINRISSEIVSNIIQIC